MVTPGVLTSLEESPQGRSQPIAAHYLARRWVNGFGLAVAVGLGYFLAARLSVGLVSLAGVAVFWPAAGISSGLLIALGARARWPVAVGVTAATIVVHQLIAEPLWVGIALGISNAVEPLITAGLLEHYFGAGFSIGRLRPMIGLFLAAIAGTAISGVGGAVTYRLFQGPSATLLTAWQDWFASDVIGIIILAPLIIGLFAAVQQLPPRSQLVEGTVALVALAVMTGIAISLPSASWETVLPIAVLFPILLWVAARCQPVFAAAAAFLVSFIIVIAAVLNLGHFSEPGLSFADLQAQVAILFVAVGAQVLAALFAERRESETRLARSNIALERERKNRLMSVEAATSSIAHEIRQPLTAVTTKAAAARRWLERGPPEAARVKGLLDDIEGAALRVSEVLTNIRRLFQAVDRGQQPIDVNNMILEALQMSNRELNDHGVKTDVELASELPPVMGFKVQLQEVISNVVNNAIDAMASVEVERRTLKVRTKLEGAKAVVIELEDSGHGIEPGRLPDIFEPFITTKPTGTGLGLAICSTIIERHGGRFAASSDGKNGALFQIVLPLEAKVADTECREGNS